MFTRPNHVHSTSPLRHYYHSNNSKLRPILRAHFPCQYTHRQLTISNIHTYYKLPGHNWAGLCKHASSCERHGYDDRLCPAMSLMPWPSIPTTRAQRRLQLIPSTPSHYQRTLTEAGAISGSKLMRSQDQLMSLFMIALSALAVAHLFHTLIPDPGPATTMCKGKYGQAN